MVRGIAGKTTPFLPKRKPLAADVLLSYGAPMQRICEPELMETEEQAEAYDRADFEEPHRRFVDLLHERIGSPLPFGDILDLGCGSCDIVVRLARRYPGTPILGIDGSDAMLRRGHERLRREPAIAPFVRLQRALIQSLDLRRSFGAIVSNSLLHHLHEPMDLWTCVQRHAKPGTRIFVGDLRRPASREEAERLRDLHADGEPDVLRRDFFNSLLAAFTTEEVEAQLGVAGLSGLHVEAVGDRHLVVGGVLV